METYNANDMKEAGLDILFVQDNQSMSSKGVLRGLHFQKQYPQTKLVRIKTLRSMKMKKAISMHPESKQQRSKQILLLCQDLQNLQRTEQADRGGIF